MKLARDHTGPHFLITNQGRGAAYDVAFSLDIEKGKASPLVDGDYDAKLPIDTLLSGEQVRLLAAISMGTDNVIDGHWRWRNEDGTTEERTGKLSL